jgi:methylated-DNA-protein-cysteine methyltransferase-like protein
VTSDGSSAADASLHVVEVHALTGKRSGPQGLYERIYDVVSSVPRGRVATYGQVAEIVGRCTPRLVGYAMASLPAGRHVPWHRVINGRGEISFPRDSEGYQAQRGMLEAEGVQFDDRGKVDLRVFGWTGPGVGGGPRPENE